MIKSPPNRVIKYTLNNGRYNSVNEVIPKLTARGAVITKATADKIEFKISEFTGTYFHITHPFYGIESGKIVFNNNGDHTEIIVTTISSSPLNIIGWIRGIIFAVFIIVMWVSLIKIHGIMLGVILGLFATLFFVGILSVLSYALMKINYYSFRNIFLKR